MQHNQILDDAISRLHKKYNLDELPIEIEMKNTITDNTRSNKNIVPQVQGRAIIGKTIDGLSRVEIVLDDYSRQTYEYASNVVHEITHIHDQIDFAKEFCDSDLEKMVSHELFSPFYLWTEFHAQYRSTV